MFVEGNVCDESLQKEMGAFGSKEEFGACGNSVSVSPQFNASIVITELLSKTLENCARELASRCIRECALRHGFDGELEIRLLGLENVSLIKKQMSKKSGPKAVKVSKDVSKGVSRVNKSTFPLPFLPANVVLTKCHGLAYNRGLFTQCSKEQMSNSAYCKGCQSECDSSASGIPCCGTVEQRLSSGLYEFKDPKGRSPIRYTKVLEKAKLSAEQAVEEACKMSINIPEEHFALAEKAAKVAGAKGRPKKATGAIDAADVADLFSKLTAPCEEKEAEAEAEAEAEEKEAEEKEEKEEPVKKKSKLSEEEKAAKKEALELERATKKAERESKLAQDKEVREANRKAEAEKKKAEREAKVAEEKAEREAKVAEEKAEREAKRLKEKEEKEAKKAAEKEAKNAKKPAATATATVAATVAAPVVTKVTVTPIEIDGKKYLITKNNVLYIAETKEEIGTYDPKTKTIKLLPDEEEEEEEQEEEYEEMDC